MIRTRRSMPPMKAEQTTGTAQVAIESHGVRLDIELDDRSLMPAVVALLPPGWVEGNASSVDATLALSREGAAHFRVMYEGEAISGPVDLDVALAFLEERIRGTVAVMARDRVFIHAGTVAYDGRAIVLPGDSFAGKTTLVAALVREGATYYSDEFAVLDPEGYVHPYPKLLSIRGARDEAAAAVPASELGGATGEVPVPVALVAVTSYRPKAPWSPVRLPPGEAALALLSHAVPARKRPAEALRAVRRVAEECACVRSERGEAQPVARALLATLDSS